jgi:hypothetical protein
MQQTQMLEEGERILSATELRLKSLVAAACKLRASYPRKEGAIEAIQTQIDATRRILFGASDARRIVALLTAADELFPPRPQEAA